MNIRRESTDSVHPEQECQEQIQTIQKVVEDLRHVATHFPLSRKKRYEMLLPIHQALSKLTFTDNCDIRDDLLGVYIREIIGSNTVGC